MVTFTTLATDNKPYMSPLKRPRDVQKQRVYKAESVIPDGGKLASLIECQSYINQVLSTDFWNERSNGYVTGIRVELGHGQYASAFTRVVNHTARVRLPQWGWTPKTMLHELAHVLTPPPTPGHGEMFCRCYIDLVKKFYSSLVAEELEKSFVVNRVAVAAVWCAPCTAERGEMSRMRVHQQRSGVCN